MSGAVSHWRPESISQACVPVLLVVSLLLDEGQG